MILNTGTHRLNSLRGERYHHEFSVNKKTVKYDAKNQYYCIPSKWKLSNFVFGKRREYVKSS